ncbi:hypothetical protein MMPV_001960 [Pyropia vietnamensis]
MNRWTSHMALAVAALATVASVVTAEVATAGVPPLGAPTLRTEGGRDGGGGSGRSYASPSPTPCPYDYPFNASLVGKTLFLSDNCYRPFFSSSTSMYRTTIVHRPSWSFRLAGNRPPAVDPEVPLCRERYILHYRRGWQAPFIVHALPTSDRALIQLPGDSNTLRSDDLERQCPKNQPRETYHPWGATRSKFLAALRVMTDGSRAIADATCESAEDDPTYRENPRLTEVVHFLQTIGYLYNGCSA